MSNNLTGVKLPDCVSGSLRPRPGGPGGPGNPTPCGPCEKRDYIIGNFKY